VWSRSLDPAHEYYCNLFDLSGWKPTSKYRILDDFGADIKKFFPHWKFFLGAQLEGVLTDKYRRKQRVRNGRATIWLCNPDSDFTRTLSRTELEWVRANCLIYELTDPLF